MAKKSVDSSAEAAAIHDLQEQFRALGAQATATAASAAALQDPAAMYPFYHRFMTLCMELDHRLGTKEMLASHGDMIKAVRAALKKRATKATTMDKLTMPFRLAAWTGVMIMSCLQIILLVPFLLPVEYVLKWTGLRLWSPFNFLAYCMTICSTAAQGIVIHVDVPRGGRKAPTPRSDRGSIVTCVWAGTCVYARNVEGWREAGDAHAATATQQRACRNRRLLHHDHAASRA